MKQRRSLQEDYEPYGKAEPYRTVRRPSRNLRLDQLQNDLQQEEAELNDLNRRILSAGEATYGPDSSEYEMLGGTRKSERKKKSTKKSGGSGTGSSTP